MIFFSEFSRIFGRGDHMPKLSVSAHSNDNVCVTERRVTKECI